MTRHLAAMFLMLLTLTAAGTAQAAQGTPTPTTESALAGFDYPELRIVVTAEGSEVPAEVPAGRILIVLDNQSEGQSDVNILQLPEGVTLEEANAVFRGEASEAPAWLAELDSAGGFNVAAGRTGYGVLDLEPGAWYIGVGDFNPYTPLTVTEDAAAPPADPSADIDLDVHEFDLGLPGRVPAGQQIWHLANTGGQVHEVMLVRTPELLTIEQVLAVMSVPDGEEPPPGVPDMSTFEFIPEGAKTMSPGREIWIEMTLEPGNYVAICSNPDTDTGQPHAALGEVSIFTVGNGATPVA